MKDTFPKAVSTQEFYNEYLSISDMLSIDVIQINYSLYGDVKKLIEMHSDRKERLQKLKYLLNISDSYAIDTSNSNSKSKNHFYSLFLLIFSNNLLYFSFNILLAKDSSFIASTNIGASLS